MTLRLRHGLFLGIFGAAVITACGIKLNETPEGVNPEAECLELFETCVELAGTSQGCEELYAHCEGSAGGTEGVEPPEGCEQDYIDCLAQGGDASSCQPLLDACLPPGGDDTGGCDPMEPGCLDGTGVEPPDTGECLPDDENCDTSDSQDCDTRHQLCLENTSADGAEGETQTCDAILDACLQGDCQRATELCLGMFPRDTNFCGELTGCPVGQPPNGDCDLLLADCQAQGIPPAECANLYPDYAGCPQTTYQCDWYYVECESQFSFLFCSDGGLACEAGWLPEIFECAFFFPDACQQAALGEVACSNAEESCYNGFEEAECAKTSLAQDPYLWLNETAECNNWNDPV